LIWSKWRTGELSPWSKEGGADGSKFVITGGAPIVGVGQEVKGVEEMVLHSHAKWKGGGERKW
jgi:hypothetical protein